MSTYFAGQEFNDVLWATPTPIMVMINSQPVRVRVRGICSAVVVDAGLLQEKMPDSTALTPQLRSALANGVADTIGQPARTAASVTELAARRDKIVSALQLNVDPIFKALGLKIKRLEIQAVEGM